MRVEGLRLRIRIHGFRARYRIRARFRIRVHGRIQYLRRDFHHILDFSWKARDKVVHHRSHPPRLVGFWGVTLRVVDVSQQSHVVVGLRVEGGWWRVESGGWGVKG